ncbi:stage III sporulation protein AG [Salsuginibacillus halophilus]|uniref:Stage III sporulation protein AG n=1 Tax=Salsuginibacillus halophilus TaxID=517424 RepID=A0A2P8HAE4_9BACI|nr:stage III sporulation protein AG [Salsuginibacillus halophilus]PSL43192.1 stage III sporulation protein AG [Salsuginibacillus halophilus]
MKRPNEDETSAGFWYRLKSGRLPLKYYYAGALIIFGVVILFISSGGTEEQEISITPEREEINSSTEDQEKNEQTSTSLKAGDDYAAAFEGELQDHLEAISGVSNVQVMIRTAGSEEKVFEKDRTARHQQTDELDQEGGERRVEEGTAEETIVFERQGDADQPVLKQTRTPEVTGVLVVADGVEHMKVKEWVIEAVTRALDVGHHRVAVLPKSEVEEDE